MLIKTLTIMFQKALCHLKKLTALHLVLAFTLSVVSCSVSNKVSYLTFESKNVNLDKNINAGLFELTLAPKDILTISVNTTIPESASPFNIGSSAGSGVQIQGGIQGAELQTYIIDNDGYINFPVTGKIKASGLTRAKLQEKIIEEIYPKYIKEVPLVNVRLKNFKISVLGEVSRPGTFTISDEQCTLFDALALAGDLTIYGKRDNIRILRSGDKGVQEIIPVNLQDVSLIYDFNKYYLRQNDVIYVEPNKAKARAAGIGSAENFSISIVSTMISIATLLITIFR